MQGIRWYHRGKAWGRCGAFDGTLACFALIIADAPPSPPGGRLLRFFAKYRDSADLSVRLRSRTKRICTAERSLPPGGEGVAPATDEGETGERTTERHVPPCVRVPGGQCALRGAPEQRRSRLLAPRLGDGVRLRGNVWLSRSPLNPVCRFAQDDTWVTGAWHHICLV